MRKYPILMLSILSFHFVLCQDTTSTRFHSKGDHLIMAQSSALLRGPDFIDLGFLIGVYPADNLLIGLLIEQSQFSRQYVYQTGVSSRYFFGNADSKFFFETSYKFGSQSNDFYTNTEKKVQTLDLLAGLVLLFKRGFIVSVSVGVEYSTRDNYFESYRLKNKYPYIPVGFGIGYLIK